MRRPASARRTATPTLTLLEERSVPTVFFGGGIQDQDGWTGGSVAIRPEVIQEVRQSGFGGNAGVGSFVVSNSTANGNFTGGVAGWPFGPGLPVTAGQPSSGATADLFSATVFFRTVSAAADGSFLEINLGTADGTDRNSIIGIGSYEDADGGLSVYVREPDAVSGNLFLPEFPASGLTRGVWHRLDIVATFRPGPANDTFTLTLNGTPLVNPATSALTYATLEAYTELGPRPDHQTNRLMFRGGARASELGTFPDNAPAGFAVDDVSYFTARTSAPTTPLASYQAGFEQPPVAVYANPAFTAPVTDAHPLMPGNQPASLGTDAFTSLAAAAAAVAPGGRVLAFGSGHAGNATIATRTILSPGGPGYAAAVTTARDVLFASGAVFEVDLLGPAVGSGYDQLSVGGAANIGGAVLRVNAGYAPNPADRFVLLQAAGGVTDRFAGLSEGAAVSVGGLTYRVRYTATEVALELDRADVSVTITDNRSSILAGEFTTYTVVVRNGGPRAASGVAVSVPLPPALLNAVYGSVATGGATGNTNGAGSIANVLDLPVGATVTYTITSRVSPAFAGTLAVTATATPPAGSVYDPVPANNTATDLTTVIPPDTLRPSVQVLADGPFTANVSATVTLRFSEPVTGLTASAVALGNAAFLALTGSGTTYTLTIVPGAGQVVVQVADAAARDAAGNPSLPGLGFFTAALPQLPPPPPAPRLATAVGGRVRLIDARDGSALEFDPFPGFGGAVSVAAGDLTGDGIPDVVVAAGPGGGPHVKAFDGKSGAELLSFFAYDERFTGGVSVAVGGGRIVTGAGPGGGPHVKVFSTAGAELFGFFAYEEQFTGGVNVAVGDLNGDGVGEIVTGTVRGAAHVRAFDGKSLAEVAGFYAFDPATYTGGVSVAAAGGTIAVGRSTGPAVVREFRPSGAEVRTFEPYPGFGGGVRVALTDVTGDGLPDLVTGAGPGGGPHVQAFALADLTPLLSFYAASPQGREAAGVFVG